MGMPKACPEQRFFPSTSDPGVIETFGGISPFNKFRIVNHSPNIFPDGSCKERCDDILVKDAEFLPGNGFHKTVLFKCVETLNGSIEYIYNWFDARSRFISQSEDRLRMGPEGAQAHLHGNPIVIRKSRRDTGLRLGMLIFPSL